MEGAGKGCSAELLCANAMRRKRDKEKVRNIAMRVQTLK